MLDYRGEIPGFMVITDGKQHECKVVKTIDLTISSDSILCVDRGYIDFEWLKNLDSKGIFFVTRAKDNMKYGVIGQHPVKNLKMNVFMNILFIDINNIFLLNPGRP